MTEEEFLDLPDCRELGALITMLESGDPNASVRYGFGKPAAWRGCARDVAFEPVENTTVGEMLGHARSALGATFDGYKGGRYTMDVHSECWIGFDWTARFAQGIGTLLVLTWIER